MCGMSSSRPTAAGPAWPVAILLALLTGAALGGVVHNGFVNYDDDLYVTANPALAAGSAGERLRWAFTTTRGGNWHPVTWISHLIDVRLFGLDPRAHHAVSLALHGANALLLFALLRGLTGTLWPGTLAAALFAVHPLHVESVAWIAERKDVLSSFFALCTALAYVRAVRRPGGAAARAAVPLLFALALLAKPMPVTLPPLLLLLDWWPLGRWSPFPGAPPHAAAPLARCLPPARLWKEKVPLLLLAAASATVTLVVQQQAGAMQAAAGVPLPARAANAAVACAAYLRKAAWPLDLGVFYPYPWEGHPPRDVALSLALLATLAALALRRTRRRPWLAVGLLWFLLALLPVVGFIQVGEQAMADRYTYLPLAGIFVAASWGLGAPAGRNRRWARAVAAAALVGVGSLGALAARQVGTWRDGVALFSQALAAGGDSSIAHNNLGGELLRRGDPAGALPHFEETIRLAPHSPNGYWNLGRTLARLGRDEQAVARFREGLVRRADDPLPHLDLGRSLERLGRREEALAAFREAARLQPRDPATLDLLGVSLARAGQAGEAIPLLEAAVALDPGNPLFRDHLAVTLAQRAAAGRGR